MELRWPSDSQCGSQQKKKNYLNSERASDSGGSPQTRDTQLLAPCSAIRTKGVQFWNPETIRENQAMRANLRIDSRESGHLSIGPQLEKGM